MSEDLQGLLNKIQSEGLQKAQAERDQIIAEAQAEAQKIIAAAEEKARKVTEETGEQVAAMEEKSKIVIQQAARDILNALKADILARLRNVVKQCAGNAMTPEYMAKLISEMAAAYAKNGNAGMEVVLSGRDFEASEAALKAALLNHLKANTEISMGQNFASGLQIGFKGSDVFLDFSDEALADVLCEFVGPKLAAALRK